MTPRSVAAADGADVRDEPGLARLGQVGREEQQPGGAGLPAAACACAIAWRGAAGGRGDDRDDVADLADRGADHRVDLGGGEREALAGAAGGEQAGDVEAGLPGEVLAVARLVEGEVGVEVRDRERQQAGARAGRRVRSGGVSVTPVTVGSRPRCLSKSVSASRDTRTASRIRPVVARAPPATWPAPGCATAAATAGAARPAPAPAWPAARTRRPGCRGSVAEAGTNAMPRPAETSQSIVRIWLTLCTTRSCASGTMLTTRS